MPNTPTIEINGIAQAIPSPNDSETPVNAEDLQDSPPDSDNEERDVPLLTSIPIPLTRQGSRATSSIRSFTLPPQVSLVSDVPQIVLEEKSGCNCNWIHPTLLPILLSLLAIPILLPGLINLAWINNVGSAPFQLHSYKDDAPFLMISGYPLIVWSLYFGSIWLIGCWIWCLWTVLPLIVARLVGMISSSTQEFILGWSESCLIWIILVCTFGISIGISPLVFGEPIQWAQTLIRLINSLLLSSLILLAAKSILFIFSLSFRRRVFDNRFKLGLWELQIVKEWNKQVSHTSLLSTLFKSWKVEKKESGWSLEAGESAFIPPLVQDGAGPGDLGLDQLPSIPPILETEIPVVKDVDVDVLIKTRRGCRTLAHHLIHGTIITREEPGDTVVTRQDFARMGMESSFSLFSETVITSSSLAKSLYNLYLKKQRLDQSLADALQALERLGKLVMSVVGVICFVIVCGSLTDVSGWVTTMVAVWAGVAFSLQNSIKTLVESIIFLFLTHPFDVGDMVNVDGTVMKVDRLGLLSTMFQGVDGKLMYSPNSVLSTKNIVNYSRSIGQSETIKAVVQGKDWPLEKRLLLRNQILQFLLENPRDYLPRCNLMVESWDMDTDKMTISFELEHKGNWSEWKRKVSRTSKMVEALGGMITGMT